LDETPHPAFALGWKKTAAHLNPKLSFYWQKRSYSITAPMKP
jgi:predicted carbohydrate-binding protein with CBM5 and CBM33 domain